MIHIVLYHPEIPQNTGNIMRTCVAIGAHLHIIGPVPFRLDDYSLRRAGLDYIEALQWTYYPDYEAYISTHQDVQTYYITRYAKMTYADVNYPHADQDLYLMFGRESTGIDHDILRDHFDHCLRIPMVAEARSLNLSNCVALVAYEVLRQQDFQGLAKEEVIKGNDFLLNEKSKIS